jgi:hypothetical protein
MPIRPPTVCTNRTEVSPTSGSFWMSGRWTAAKRIAAGPRRTVVAPILPPPAVFDVDVGAELVGLAEPVGLAELLEIAGADPVGRRRVVVGDPELERDLGDALDRLGRDPGDGGHA